jgi:ABC-type dipeptide/oligopeptide/nickel transport system permease subunit
VNLMKIRLCQLVVKLYFWLVAEALLGFLGLDDLADYGEYLKEDSSIVLLSPA